MTNHTPWAEEAGGGRNINHLQTKQQREKSLMFFVAVVTFVVVVYELQTGRAFLHSAVGSEREHNIIQKHDKKAQKQNKTHTQNET